MTAADLRVDLRASVLRLQTWVTNQGEQHPGGQSSSAETEPESQLLLFLSHLLFIEVTQRQRISRGVYFLAESRLSLAASTSVSLNMTASVWTITVLSLRGNSQGHMIHSVFCLEHRGASYIQTCWSSVMSHYVTICHS